MLIESETAFVYPGQGKATIGVGMGASLLHHENLDIAQVARLTFEEADDTLKEKFSDIFLHGPPDILSQQSNSQPSAVVVGVAASLALKSIDENASILGGHSVGEISALVGAGVITLREAVLLARERGILMAREATSHPGVMYAVLNLTEKEVSEICEITGVFLANRNTPKQSVISGTPEKMLVAIDLINEKKKSEPQRKITSIDLKVTAAAHSPLMKGACENLAKHLETVPIKNPQRTIISGITGEVMKTAEDVKHSLVNGLSQGVKWVRTTQNMIDHGAKTIVHVGHGRILADFARDITNKSVTVYTSDQLLGQGST